MNNHLFRLNVFEGTTLPERRCYPQTFPAFKVQVHLSSLSSFQCRIFFFCQLFTEVFEGSTTVPVNETKAMLVRP